MQNNLLKDITGRASVFVIAEIGCNFENDFERAKEMVKEAALAGADAVKFQTFVPDKLVTRDAPKFWDIEGCPGETQYEEFNEMPQLSFNQYQELKQVADDAGIVLFSTPADEESADMLEKLGVSIYKISSMDITHHPLIRHIAKKKKPIILSTGASTIDEIREAVEIIESEGNGQIILLHCTTNYPTKIEDVNLNMIRDIIEKFPQHTVGYSDHTKMPESLYVLTAAVAMGVKVIEKHFTFDKSRPGYDHEISADYEDLRNIVNSFRVLEKAMGIKTKKPTKSENKARKFARRSLVAKLFIPKGTKITQKMIVIKRPGTGIEPKFLNDLVGKKTRKDINEDEVIFWDRIDHK
ncbi:MAG: N-acetylneuraminate synthase family protein [Candidatus Altiarchaeota archaeon]